MIYYLNLEEDDEEDGKGPAKLLVFKDLHGKLWQISPAEEAIEMEFNEHIANDENFEEDDTAAAAAAAAVKEDSMLTKRET